MNIEAFFAIGAFSIVVGVILAAPCLWFARRRAENLSENSSLKFHVTKSGLCFFAVFISLLMIALGGKALWPQISPILRTFFVFFVFLVGVVVEKSLDKIGFPLFKKERHGSNS
jgi:hypothetical protein